MNLLLLSPRQDLLAAWRDAFAGLPAVRLHEGPFESAIGAYDGLVSPGNAFGLLDGGMDLAVANFFGPALGQRLREEIWRVYRAQQPVGTCLLVPTGDPRCPRLAHCPTMVIPADLRGTANAFAAFLAALTTAEAHGIGTLACPGLGTGAGQLPAAVAARQMRYAYDLWRGPRPAVTWPWTETHLRATGGTRP